jgi:uncharacterized membrane protein
MQVKIKSNDGCVLQNDLGLVLLLLPILILHHNGNDEEIGTNYYHKPSMVLMLVKIMMAIMM